MKLLPPDPHASSRRPTTRWASGWTPRSTICLFFGIGFVLDRWLGTTPWFMIGMTMLAAVGFFLKFKYRYDLEMNRLEAERLARLAPAKRRRIAMSDARTRHHAPRRPGPGGARLARHDPARSRSRRRC